MDCLADLKLEFFLADENAMLSHSVEQIGKISLQKIVFLEAAGVEDEISPLWQVEFVLGA